MAGSNDWLSGDSMNETRATVQAAGRAERGRRILVRFMRYGSTAQPASLVRGSSRRIMTMRFRPADIRVISRRFSRISCFLRCGSISFIPLSRPG